MSPSGPPAALAAKRATPIIPIVFMSGADPVQLGSGFKLPSARAEISLGSTSLSPNLRPKRLALLHELLPDGQAHRRARQSRRCGYGRPDDAGHAIAGARARPRIEVFNASTSAEIDAAFAAFSKLAARCACSIGSDPLFNTERARLVALAAHHALPAIHFQRDHVEAGGLMSYGPDYRGFLSSGRRLCRSYPKGRKTGRFAGPAADQSLSW